MYENNKDDKESQLTKQEKKKLLIEQYQKQHKNKVAKKTNNKKVSNAKMNKVLDRVNKLQNQLNKQTSKNKQLKNQIKQYQTKNHQLSKQIDNILKQNTIEKEQIDQQNLELQKQFDILKSAGWNEDMDLKQILNSYQNNNDELTKKNNILDNTNHHLQNVIKQMEQQNKKLHKKINKNNRPSVRAKYNLLQSDYEMLNKQYQNLLNKYNQKTPVVSMQEADAVQLIKLLTKQLKKENNINYFEQLNELFELYVLKFINKKAYLYNQINHQYGFLIHNHDNSFNFFDVNNNISVHVNIPIRYKHDKHLQDGAAVRVISNEAQADTVTLDYIYSIPSHTNYLKNKQHSKQQNEEIKKEVPLPIQNKEFEQWITNKNLVVIGNKHVKPFVKILKQYTKNIKQFDAYENGLQHIDSQIKSKQNDYVLILLDSIPHAIMNYLKSNDLLDNKKIQYFNYPAPDAGIVRLFYIYKNL